MRVRAAERNEKVGWKRVWEFLEEHRWELAEAFRRGAPILR